MFIKKKTFRTDWAEAQPAQRHAGPPRVVPDLQRETESRTPSPAPYAARTPPSLPLLHASSPPPSIKRAALTAACASAAALCRTRRHCWLTPPPRCSLLHAAAAPLPSSPELLPTIAGDSRNRLLLDPPPDRPVSSGPV